MTPTQIPGVGGVLTVAPTSPLNQQGTIEDLLAQAKRDAVPIRNEFLQLGHGKSTKPGPLAEFVKSQDLRGLQAYLLVRAVVSNGEHGWDCTLDSDTWIRALDLRATAEEAAARSAVSKTFGRLVRRGLIERGRVGRKSSLVLLREDGSGVEYTHPGVDREPYFKLPHSFWIEKHHQILTMPGIAVLLIALSRQDDFILPFAQGKPWYGIGAETIQTGVHQLQELGVLEHRTEWIVNAKAKGGYQSQRYYTLTGPYSSAARTSKRATAKPAATPLLRRRVKKTRTVPA